MSRRQFRYDGRYVLANGTPRAFTVYAWNKSDAAAAVEQQARETLGDRYAGALFYGVERNEPAVAR